MTTTEKNLYNRLKSQYRVGCATGLIEINQFYEIDPYRYVTDEMVKRTLLSLQRKNLIRIYWVTKYLFKLERIN